MTVGKVETFHLKNKQMCVCNLRAEVKTFCSIFQLIPSPTMSQVVGTSAQKPVFPLLCRLVSGMVVQT